MRVIAYIDPSVMTYAIQAVAGIVIASGAVFGIYWRKIRRFLEKKGLLHSLQKKEKESDHLYFADPGRGGEKQTPAGVLSEEEWEALQKAAEEEAARTKAKKEADERKRARRKRILDVLPVILLPAAIAFLLTLYAPLELYLSNTDEFWFDLYLMLPQLLKPFLAFLAIGIGITFLAFRRWPAVYRILLAAGLILFLGSYIQGNFMAANLPPLDGSPIDWAAYHKETVQSLLLWGAVAAGVVAVAVFLRKKKGLEKLAVFLPALIGVMLLVSLALLAVRGNGLERKTQRAITVKNELQLSTDENLIIFMLDAVDAMQFREVWESDPAWKDVYDGFTFYENTLAAYPYTKYAVPFVLTGKWNEHQERFLQFETEAMEESALFSTLEDRGYKMGLYEQDLAYDSPHVTRFENIMDTVADGFTDNRAFLSMQAKLVGFKYAPYPLKKHCVFDMDQFHALQETVEEEAFTMNNLAFDAMLKEQGIRTTEEKCFRFIHLEGAHAPFRYTRDVEQIPEEEGTYRKNLECCVTLCDRYLQALKDAGVYDNSAILILADHGYDGEDTSIRQNPLLMVKGKNERHTMRISDAPIHQEDLMQAYLRLLDGAASEEVFDWKEGDSRERRHLFYEWRDENHLVEYTLQGMAWEREKMQETGRVFVGEEG